MNSTHNLGTSTNNTVVAETPTLQGTVCVHNLVDAKKMVNDTSCANQQHSDRQQRLRDATQLFEYGSSINTPHLSDDRLQLPVAEETTQTEDSHKTNTRTDSLPIHAASATACLAVPAAVQSAIAGRIQRKWKPVLPFDLSLIDEIWYHARCPDGLLAATLLWMAVMDSRHKTTDKHHPLVEYLNQPDPNPHHVSNKATVKPLDFTANGVRMVGKFPGKSLKIPAVAGYVVCLDIALHSTQGTRLMESTKGRCFVVDHHDTSQQVLLQEVPPTNYVWCADVCTAKIVWDCISSNHILSSPVVADSAFPSFSSDASTHIPSNCAPALSGTSDPAKTDNAAISVAQTARLKSPTLIERHQDPASQDRKQFKEASEPLSPPTISRLPDDSSDHKSTPRKHIDDSQADSCRVLHKSTTHTMQSALEAVAYLVDCIDDMDTWLWRKSYAHEISMAMKLTVLDTHFVDPSAELAFRRIMQHLSGAPRSIVNFRDFGIPVCLAINTYVMQMCNTQQWCTLVGFEHLRAVVVFHCHSLAVSYLGHYLASQPNVHVAVLVSRCRTNKHTSVVSLRSVGDVNVADIAGVWGGGGHVNAASYCAPHTCTTYIVHPPHALYPPSAPVRTNRGAVRFNPPKLQLPQVPPSLRKPIK